MNGLVSSKAAGRCETDQDGSESQNETRVLGTTGERKRQEVEASPRKETRLGKTWCERTGNGECRPIRARRARPRLTSVARFVGARQTHTTGEAGRTRESRLGCQKTYIRGQPLSAWGFQGQVVWVCIHGHCLAAGSRADGVLSG